MANVIGTRSTSTRKSIAAKPMSAVSMAAASMEGSEGAARWRRHRPARPRIAQGVQKQGQSRDADQDTDVVKERSKRYTVELVLIGPDARTIGDVIDAVCDIAEADDGEVIADCKMRVDESLWVVRVDNVNADILL